MGEDPRVLPAGAGGGEEPPIDPKLLAMLKTRTIADTEDGRSSAIPSKMQTINGDDRRAHKNIIINF